MAEWLKVHAWKACVRETVPWVRIPPHPLFTANTDEALAFLSEQSLQPTLVIHTGGGLLALWLFDELQVVTNDAARAQAQELSRRVQGGLITRGGAYNWKLDDTSSLAQGLRPPGSLNHKVSPPLPVTLLHGNDARYRPADLVELCERQAPVINIARNFDSVPADKRARAYLAKVGHVAEGERDLTAFRVAAFLVRTVGLTAGEALGYLRDWNARNSPPLPDRQLQDKVKSAARRGAA